MNRASSPTGQIWQNPPYFTLLTLLRGAAALAVVLYHTCNMYRTHDQSPFPGLGILLPLFNQGWFGVDVFFLISGYGLAAKLSHDATLQGPRGAAVFTWNRLTRIYPVYWASCLMVFGIAYISSHFNHLDWRQALPPSLSGVLASGLLLEPWTGTPPIVPIVTWALSVELGFYAIVTLGVLARTLINDTILLGAAIVLAFANLNGWNPGQSFVLAHWPEFACGVLVFAAVKTRLNLRTYAFRLILGILMALGLAAWIGSQTRQAAAVALGIGLVVIWPYDRAISGTRWLRWLTWTGVISYPLFLIHIPVISRCLNFGQRWIHADTLIFLPVIILAAFFTFILAWSVHRCIERPLRGPIKSTSISSA